DGPPRPIDDRQMPISTLLHAADGRPDRLRPMHDHGVSGHAIAQRQRQGPGRRQDAAQQVALAEDAEQPAGVADQDAADAMLAHEIDGVADGGVMPQAQRRRGLQPLHALDQEVTSQLHDLSPPLLVTTKMTMKRPPFAIEGWPG